MRFIDLVNAVSSHESATFWGGGGNFCGRVARLATSQGLLDLPAQTLQGLEIRGVGFRISSVGFRVSGFGFRVSGFGIQVSVFDF